MQFFISNQFTFMNYHKLLLGILLSIFLVPVQSFAQCDSLQLAPDSVQFVTSDGGGIGSIERKGDTLYVAGGFSSIGRYTGSFTGIEVATGKLTGNATWPKSDGIIRAAIPDGSNGWLIAGNFTRVGDSLRSNIAHINSSGKVTGFKIDYIDGEIYTLALHNDTIYFGGDFDTVNYDKRRHIAALKLSTARLTSWNPEANGLVRKLVYDNNLVYVGGDFTIIGDSNRRKAAAINVGTGKATYWNTYTINESVYDIYIHGSSVYLGGNFTYVGSSTNNCRKIAILDKATGSLINWSSPFTTTTNWKTVYKINKVGTRIFISGRFDSIADSTRYNMAVIDSATATVLPWNPMPKNLNEIYDFKIVNDKVYCVQNEALVTIDTSNANNTNTISLLSCDEIYTITLQGSKIFVGGDLHGAGCVERNSLAALNLSTSEVLPWKVDFVGSSTIFDMVLDSNRLYIMGQFNQIGSTVRKGFASFNIDSNYKLTSWNPGVSQNGKDYDQIKVHGNYVYAITDNYSGTGGGGTYFKNIWRSNKHSGVIDSWKPSSYLCYPMWVEDIEISDTLMAATVRDASGSPHHAEVLTYNFKTNSWDTVMSEPINNTYGNAYYKTMLLMGDKMFLEGELEFQPAGRRSAGAFKPPYAKSTATDWTPYPSNDVNKVHLYAVVGDKILARTPRSGNQYSVGIKLFDTSSGTAITGWRPRFNHRHPQNFGTPGISDISYENNELIIAGVGNISGKNFASLAIFKLDNNNQPTAKISSPDTICAGSSIKFTVTTSVNGGTYQWRKNGTKVGSNLDNYTYTPTNGDIVTCTVKIPFNSNNCYMVSEVTATDTVSVTTNTKPAISLTASDDTVCAGTKVYYSVSTNMPKADFQWRIIGTSITGSNSDTFSCIPSNGNVISCMATKAAGTCFAPASITVDTTMVVIANTTPNISISDTASSSLCPGATDSFTATTNIVGASYQWQVNGNGVGTNNNAYTYAPANNDKVVCVITMPAGCYTQQKDTSNIITINHLTPTIPVISINASTNPVCTGTTVNFTATTNIPAGNYKWKVGGNVVGSTNTYSYSPTNNDQVSCTILAPAGCYIPDTGNSNIITMKVNPKVTPTINITGPASMGEHGVVNLNANVSDAGSNYSIDWNKNGSLLNTTSTPATSYTKEKGTDNIIATITPVGCYNPATSNTLVITEAVSISSIGADADDIMVYPNPTHNAIHIQGLLAGDEVALLDVAGKKILSSTYTTTGSVYTIDVEHVPAGVYMLVIKADNGVTKSRKKIQKQ